MSNSLSEPEKKAFREMVPMSSLSDREFDDVCNTCRVDGGAPGTLLFRQGEPNGPFYFLLSGKVSLAIGDVPIETIEAGSATACFALAHQFPRKVTAAALTPIRFVRLDANRFEHLESDSTRPTVERQSITDLLIRERKALPTDRANSNVRKTEFFLFKRWFGWARNRIHVSKVVDAIGKDAVLSVDHPKDRFAARLAAYPDHSGRRFADQSDTDRFTEEKSNPENNWQRDLPGDIENQLKALLIPLMRNVSDISGSLVTTDLGSLFSPEFPTHRIERIRAIVRAAIATDQPEVPNRPDDAPEEILVREKNSVILIFLIGTQGLLALNANHSANLGLIRLEASPIANQVREIISKAM